MTAGDVRCGICNSVTQPLDRAEILGKYQVQYYSCGNCGFVQTEQPYWLDEAYNSPIARSDIGLIGRNAKLAEFCSAVIPIIAGRGSAFLDYGGGNGMFVRMMRDRGFNFFWHDAYTVNQFAAGFEMQNGARYSLVTAFEVFEHLSEPLGGVQEMFEYADTLIFSTRLLPAWGTLPDAWWYFTPDTGQHVSLYSRESLQFIARRFGVHLSTNGVSLHILSQRRIPGPIMNALSFRPFASTVAGLLNVGRRSLLDQDYYRLTGRKLKGS